jgi:hypothetical protein
MAQDAVCTPFGYCVLSFWSQNIQERASARLSRALGESHARYFLSEAAIEEAQSTRHPAGASCQGRAKRERSVP